MSETPEELIESLWLGSLRPGRVLSAPESRKTRPEGMVASVRVPASFVSEGRRFGGWCRFAPETGVGQIFSCGTLLQEHLKCHKRRACFEEMVCLRIWLPPES